ncbi:uncharacterized protein LOC135133259 [Zophobas morio]|uniref:uncharacterized protein LOC135133259 n=1 Tax=Zophobas morio TaxID=2755281 RepID=UPI00308356F0
MEVAIVTPSSSLDKLKCSSCSSYLSYFPIRVCANNQNICGRCVSPAEEDSVFQNIAFETLSQFLKFPCRYANEGCAEQLQPNKVPEHEETCPFKIISCPVKKLNKCKWTGPRPTSLHHCETEHRKMFLTEGSIAMDFSSDKQSHHLIKFENSLLIFAKTFNPLNKIIQFEMYTTELEAAPIQFSAQVSVQCDETSLSHDFVTTNFDEISLNELKLDSVVTAKTGTLKVTILEAVVDPSRVINLEMLAVLKCFRCSGYAVPPIYYCITNSQTLCSDCKPIHQRACNTCSRNNSNRNFNLDRMAEKLNYPCKYQANGCAFISSPSEIKKHQSVCELGDFECPMNEFDGCAWKGLLQDLEEHVGKCHEQVVTSSSNLTKQLLPGQMNCDIFKFSSQLFRMVCLKTSEGKHMWSMQVIGPFKEEYRYEIEIVDPKERGRRLLIRQQCGLLTKKEDLFKNGNGFCYFLNDQIGEFASGHDIGFKVHIFV